MWLPRKRTASEGQGGAQALLLALIVGAGWRWGVRWRALGCTALVGLLVALAGVRAAVCDESRVDLLLKFVVACGIAVPIYLVWSRGWERGLLAAAAFLGSVVVLALVPFFTAGYAVWGAVFFRPA